MSLVLALVRAIETGARVRLDGEARRFQTRQDPEIHADMVRVRTVKPARQRDARRGGDLAYDSAAHTPGRARNKKSAVRHFCVPYTAYTQ